VLARGLTFVEREQGDRPARPLEERAADHRSLLVADQPQRGDGCGRRQAMSVTLLVLYPTPLAHAVEMSTGGAPHFMIVGEEG
jgi:hypothetical protein